MQRLPSGHYTIDVLNCGHQDWQVPDAAVQVGRRIEEFRIGSQHGGDHQLFGRFCCHPGARHEPHAAVAVRRAAGQHGRLVQCTPSVAGAQPREPITPREPSKRTAKVGDYKLWVDSGRATKLTARKSKTAAPVAISDCDRPQE